MLILFLVVLVTSNPAPVRVLSTSSRFLTSPAAAMPSKPPVMACSASSLFRGWSLAVVTACRLIGSSGSCNPKSPLMAVRHALIRRPSAPWKYG